MPKNTDKKECEEMPDNEDGVELLTALEKSAQEHAMGEVRNEEDIFKLLITE
jgi:hypothetical protein